MPLLRDVKSQAPQAICELVPANASANLIINRDALPFDNSEMRRALALSLDRKAFIDILAEGHGDIGGAMQPPPEGVWGMPPAMLEPLPGYGPNVQQNRAEARGIMNRLGYGPEKRLAVKVSERNIPIFRDPAVILIDQLKEIYVDGELEPVDTTQWFPRPTARISPSRSISPATASTIPTRISTRTTPVVRKETTSNTAIPSSIG